MTAVVETLVDRERDAWRRLVEEARRLAGRRAAHQRALRRLPRRGGEGCARRPRRRRGRGPRRRHGPRPRPGAALGVAAAGQDGRPAALPPLPRDRAPRRGRPEVLALPGRARDPRPLVGRPPRRARPPRRRTSARARRARSCGCGPPRSSASTWPASTPRPQRPNDSLGLVEAELLRRINERLPRSERVARAHPPREGDVRPRGARRLARPRESVRAARPAPRLGARALGGDRRRPPRQLVRRRGRPRRPAAGAAARRPHPRRRDRRGAAGRGPGGPAAARRRRRAGVARRGRSA